MRRIKCLIVLILSLFVLSTLNVTSTSFADHHDKKADAAKSGKKSEAKCEKCHEKKADCKCHDMKSGECAKCHGKKADCKCHDQKACKCNKDAKECKCDKSKDCGCNTEKGAEAPVTTEAAPAAEEKKEEKKKNW